MLLPDTAPCELCKWPAPLIKNNLCKSPYALHPIEDQEQCIQRALKHIPPPKATPKRPSRAKAETLMGRR